MEQILELFFGNPDYNLTYGLGPLAAVGISAGASLLGGILDQKKQEDGKEQQDKKGLG